MRKLFFLAPVLGLSACNTMYGYHPMQVETLTQPPAFGAAVDHCNKTARLILKHDFERDMVMAPGGMLGVLVAEQIGDTAFNAGFPTSSDLANLSGGDQREFYSDCMASQGQTINVDALPATPAGILKGSF